jgi:nucleotide-binding universal stress UspA family protein
MSTVLVAVDGSPSALHAVEHAAAIAKRASADVCVLNVQLPIGPGRPETAADRAQIEKLLDAQARPVLDAATAILRDRGVAHQARMAVGEIAQTIVATAQQVGAEQIIMGSRGMSALPGLMVGSNATKVVHLAQVPVTIVK